MSVATDLIKNQIKVYAEDVTETILDATFNLVDKIESQIQEKKEPTVEEPTKDLKSYVGTVNTAVRLVEQEDGSYKLLINGTPFSSGRFEDLVKNWGIAFPEEEVKPKYGVGDRVQTSTHDHFNNLIGTIDKIVSTEIETPVYTVKLDHRGTSHVFNESELILKMRAKNGYNK